MTRTANNPTLKEITHPLRRLQPHQGDYPLLKEGSSLRPPRIIYIRGPLSVTLSGTYVATDRVPFLPVLPLYLQRRSLHLIRLQASPSRCPSRFPDTGLPETWHSVFF